MKTQTKERSRTMTLQLAFTCAAVVGCGTNSHPGFRHRAPPVVAVAENGIALKEGLTMQSLAFTETAILLTGNSNVKKVEQDGAGNYYAAFVTDHAPKGEAQADAGAGYVLIKFDVTGKEVWRFPTLENSAISNDTANKVGSYFLGRLADMTVTPEGRIFLIGLNSIKENAESAWNVSNKFSFSGSPNATVDKPDANDYVNLVFLSQIDGEKMDANSPRLLSQANFAAPKWWTPSAIRMDGGAITIESSSGMVPNEVGVVQQVQRLDPSFSRVIESACFVSAGVNTSTGDAHLLNIASAAAESLVNRMGQADSSVEQWKATNGACWDLIGTQVMPAADAAYKITKPVALANGQPMISRVEKMDDLLPSGKGTFEEYDVAIDFTDGRWFALGEELIHFGIETLGHIGEKELAIGNARSVEAKSFQVSLNTSALRDPSSTDLLVSKENAAIVAVWTELRLAGETHASTRTLRVAQLPITSLKQDQTKYFEFEVPAKTGYTSFSSVRLAKATGSKMAVFAIASSIPDAASATPSKQVSTLLIGFTK